MNVLQKRAVALLVHLSTEELPNCQWLVLDVLGLEGAVIVYPETDSWYEIQCWAKYLGSEIVRENDSRTMHVSGMKHGVPVKVTIHIRGDEIA